MQDPNQVIVVVDVVVVAVVIVVVAIIPQISFHSGTLNRHHATRGTTLSLYDYNMSSLSA